MRALKGIPGIKLSADDAEDFKGGDESVISFGEATEQPQSLPGEDDALQPGNPVEKFQEIPYPIRTIPELRPERPTEKVTILFNDFQVDVLCDDVVDDGTFFILLSKKPIGFRAPPMTNVIANHDGRDHNVVFICNVHLKAYGFHQVIFVKK